MIKALHGLSTMYCNCMTEVRIAKETGYDAVEFLESKIVRFLDSGRCIGELKELMDKYSIKASCINALKAIERYEKKDRSELMDEAEVLCKAAQALKCPTIQLVPLNTLAGRPYEEILDIVCKNISEIADVGKSHGVRFQIEVIAFSPIKSLTQGLEIIERVGKSNVGMVIDFWHLYAGCRTTPEDVARIDKSMIFGVHFCDGVKKAEGEYWDEYKLRAYMPGEGDIPVQEWVDAVRETGYDGAWSPELLHRNMWESDIFEVAKACLENMNQYIGK